MTLTIELPADQIDTLNAKANAEGVTAEHYAQELLKQALICPEGKLPLAQRIRQIWADLPEEELAKLPTDGASQHDHYIYGWPKRQE